MADAFEEYLKKKLAELGDIYTAEIYNALRNSIEGATRAEILDIARRQAAELVKQVGDSIRASVRELVTDGMEAQAGIDEIAREIRKKIPLDAQRQKRLDDFEADLAGKGYSPAQIAKLLAKEETRLIAERAETISRTEVRRSVEEAELDVAKKRGATHKVSISVGDSKVSDICRRCESQGPIRIDERFASGSSTPPHHPNCRCTIAKFTDTGKGEVDEYAERARNRAKDTEKAQTP